MKRIIISLMLLLLLAACDKDYGLTGQSGSHIVVEGWIEDGGFPVVIVSRSFPVVTEYEETESLSDYLVRWAKVTVSNGTDSVVLTGKYDEGYFPPYVYTTGRMRGEAGKSYTVTVEYRDYYATATTTIPPAPGNCDFRVERCADNDTMFQIKAVFQDNPNEKNYYQFFTRVGSTTKQYQASYLGTFDDAVLAPVTETPVYRGHQLKFDYTPYYKLRDTVAVKFAHIDETSFRVWDSYTKTLSLSKNMFLSTNTNMITNIVGGYGYWCGFSAITHYFVIRDSIAN